MNARARIPVFLTGALGIAVCWALAARQLPGPEDQRSRYLTAVTSRSVSLRNATDTVTAVNFDFRGFDTLGEEFILFVSVVGAMVLLRRAGARDKPVLVDALSNGRDVPASDAMRVWILALVAPKIILGLYIVAHGQLTPGGGFQGGVVLATAALILYLGEGFKLFRRVVPHTLVEVTEAAGALAYVVIGLIAFFAAKPYLTNTLPLGKPGEPTSGGTMPLISAATGFEVAAGFTLLLFAFLQETLTEDTPEDKP